MRILVVEDDTLVADAIRRGLQDAGHAVDCVGSAEQALAAVDAENFNLALIDIGLPGADGLALLAQLRRQHAALPVLMLTARDGMADRVGALDQGADDYMVKPFALAELVARCRALLRRSHSVAAMQLRFGACVLDFGARRACGRDGDIALTRREWAVLECLALNTGRVVAKDRLLQAIASWDADIGANAIEVYVSRLRNKLGAEVPLRTVRGLGYRLDVDAG
ncbi:MAG: response regulator transcription factor [Dokdonella sp.]|uniref:response regulator n=1 Tax=Dokdonella sp. TaxID=2291710 RepID=UPI0027BA61BE|nr:response regulator transcription factor [Dokdonella sp.]MCW5578247.1 response regulator transcription factor [Dokdonella sp.]